MSRQDALLQAILDEPDDDAPRLIYADWLEERGDPRAEFIRAQCALAQLPADDERRPDLEACEARLLAGHGKGWAGPIRRRARAWTFRRGFVEGIKIGADAFLAHTADLFAAAPIRHVRFVHAAGHIDELAACPYLGRLDSLDLHANLTLQSAPELPEIPGTNLPTAVWSAR